MSTIGFFFMLFPIFAYCYYGDLVRKELEEVAVVVYVELAWYQFPVNTRRHLVTIIRMSQKPQYFGGFNILSMQCSMENFTNVSIRQRFHSWSRIIGNNLHFSF